MTRSAHQNHVKAYHEHLQNDLKLDMFVIHDEWHQQNRDPNPTLLQAQDPENWTTEEFGTRFLEMHHGMLHTTNSGQHGHAGHHGHPQHPGIFDWYEANHLDLPAVWFGQAPIPADLGFEADLNDLGPTMRAQWISWFDSEGDALQALERNPNYSGFQLPGWATEHGIQKGEKPEPYTGARKLQDFKNLNQLGSCLVFPHNLWHGRIGGAMSSTATAIADPVFYFGVHRAIDEVYQRYLEVKSRPPHAPGMFPSQVRSVRAFTEAEQQQAVQDHALSLALSQRR